MNLRENAKWKFGTFWKELKVVHVFGAFFNRIELGYQYNFGTHWETSTKREDKCTKNAKSSKNVKSTIYAKNYKIAKKDKKY